MSSKHAKVSTNTKLAPDSFLVKQITLHNIQKYLDAEKMLYFFLKSHIKYMV